MTASQIWRHRRQRKMIIPGYDVGDALGEGGMGVVYEASQTGVGRTVALKILAPHYASDTEFVQRFLREGRNASAINSPYVVQVYDAGRSGDILFIAQEYMSGGDIDRLMQQSSSWHGG